MTAPKFSKIQRERDRLTIGELHLKGWSQQQIADFMELNKSHICRELQKVKIAWKAEPIEEHRLYVQKELRRLAILEAEYRAAWERSQQQAGDAVFLNGIQKVIDTRCKLLGRLS